MLAIAATGAVATCPETLAYASRQLKAREAAALAAARNGSFGSSAELSSQPTAAGAASAAAVAAFARLCRHLYIDVGSNDGVQAEKLYEPG